MRVVVTGAAEGLERLATRLRDAGLDVVECPLLRIEPITSPLFVRVGTTGSC